MFKADRIYSLKNPRTGKVTWYFQSREGDSGPYQSKDEAVLMLKEYIQECIETGNNGGRHAGHVKPNHIGFDPNAPKKPTFRYTGKQRWFG